MRELLGILETPLESNRPLVERARHVTDRRREILQLQRLHDLPDAHTHGLQRLWLELDGRRASQRINGLQAFDAMATFASERVT